MDESKHEQKRRFLFLKTYPKGRFSETAISRLEEFDPIWKEVKNSSDPYDFIDYIRNYPDSPLIDRAGERMAYVDELRKEWAKIENTRTASVLRTFIKRAAGTNLAQTATKALELLEAQRWEQTRLNGLSAHQAYLKEFPDGAHAADAKAYIRAVTTPVQPTKASEAVSFLWAIHAGHGFGGFGRAYGKLEFDGATLKYTELEKEDYKDPDLSHNFAYSCSALKGVKGKDWIYVRPKDKVEILLSADEKSDRVKAFVDQIVTACNLPGK